ncbi:hypothetical protein BC833DRAFT_15693 [Globomyces pollinis-pini]|nr:hypothetical protein BC833DRAFT_15693 [Globomyces pollinis-pini]
MGDNLQPPKTSEEALSGGLKQRSSKNKDSRQGLDIIQTIPLNDDDGERNAEFAKAASSLNLAKASPIERIINKWSAIIMEKYYENVTYKTECVLLLLLLSPFPMIAILIPNVGSIILADEGWSLGFRFAITLLGYIAIHGSELVNHRHAHLATISKIINGEATVRSLSDSVKGEGLNQLLYWSTYLFYTCLIVAELSMSNVPYPKSHGVGSAYTVANTFQNSTPIDGRNVLFLSFGINLACSDCVGMVSNNVLLVPLTVSLRDISLDAGHEFVFLEATQDIAALSVSCFSADATYTDVAKTDLAISVIELSKGVRTSLLDLEISSWDSSLTSLKTRRCSIIAREFSGFTRVRYGIDEQDKTVTRLLVDYIGPNAPKSCQKIGNRCLDDPKIPNLTYSLFAPVFDKTVHALSKSYASMFRIFPDPSTDVADVVYEKEMAESIGLVLLAARSHLATTIEPYSISSPTSIVLDIDYWFMILTIITAIFCPIVAALIVTFDLIKLEKAPDSLLRRLSQSVKPGKRFLEDISTYVSHIYVPSQDDWDFAPVRFGEDKKTTSDPLGLLRFGGKKDIVKFKNGRPYY